MKTTFSAIAVGLGVAMLLVFAVNPVSAGCPIGSIPEWDGSEDNLWTTEANWVNDFEPSFFNDDACLHLDGGDNICEYDTFLGNISWDVTVFGANPTFFTFNQTVTQGIFPGSFDLQDYASLDIDQCVDLSGFTDISGRVSIDVVGGIDCCLGGDRVQDESAELDLIGTVKFEKLAITAHNGSQSIRLTVDDGGTILADEFEMEAEHDTTDPAYIAGLHLKDGTIIANELNIWAGQTNDRRVSLDLDENMTVKNKTKISVFPGGLGDGGGYVTIDVKGGVTLDTGELVINGPSVVKVTGVAAGALFGKVASSTNEEAPDNGCTCP